MKDHQTIKLGDFGLSSRLEYPKQRRRTICGTPNYIAPEIIGAKTTHSFEVDVWSLGVIAFILLTGNPPFLSKNIKETYRKIRQCEYKIAKHLNLSLEVQDFIRVMLEKDSSKRATLEELNVHPYITKNGLLDGPLQLTHSQELKIIKEDSKDGSDDSQNPDSENVANGINLGKKATLHSHLPSQPQLNKNDLAALESAEYQDLPKVWVVKAVDYSAKYGLGYLLSNGHIGTFFNDNTKMLLNPKGSKLVYYSYDEEGKI